MTDARATDTEQNVKNSGANLLTIISQASIPVYHGLVMNLFGAAGYGIYAPALLILDIPARAGMCAMDFGLLRMIPMHRARGEDELEMSAVGTAIRTTLASGLFLAALCGLVALLLKGVLGDSSAGRLVGVLAILAWSLPFTLLTLTLAALTLATKTARGNLWIRGCAEPAFLLAGSLIVAFTAASTTALAAAHVAASAATCAVAFVVTARLYGGRRLARAILRAPHHHAMERFALPLVGSDFLNAVSQHFHAFVIPIWVADEALRGIYFGAEFFARVINNTRYGFDTIICPIISEAHTTRDRARIQYNLSLLSRWILTLALPIVLAMLLYPIQILEIGGRDFSQGAFFLAAFALAMGLNASFGLTGWVIAMTGRSRLALANNAAAVVLNVALSLWLIPIHGIMGALVATISAMVSIRILENIEAYALERVHLFNSTFAKPLIAAAASLIAQLALTLVLPASTASMVVAAAVGFIIYVISFVAVGLSPEEWRLLERVRWIRRFRFGAEERP